MGGGSAAGGGRSRGGLVAALYGAGRAVVGRVGPARALAAFLAAALLVTAGWWAQHRARANAWAAAVYSLRGRVVAIDPGHGGIDPGAIAASGTNEDTVVLAVSLRVAAMLQQAGAIVVLTRTGDSDLALQTEGGPSARKRVDLRSRVALINASAADVVVSIHANHFSNPAEHGAQTFYNAQRFAESKELATVMQGQLHRVTGETKRLISEHINHYVLNHSDMPGVTVEIGFLSNPREARMLAEPVYQDRIAFAIYRALALWFARLPQAASPVAPPGPSSSAAPGGAGPTGAPATAPLGPAVPAAPIPNPY